MGTVERREREREELRRKILEAARALLLREGPQGVTMRRIAEAVEYSPTAIYLHFEDKDDVVHTLCSEDFQRLFEALQDAPPPADPLTAVRQLGRAYARFALTRPDHYRVMFMTPHEHEVSQEDAGVRAFGLLLEVVQKAVDAGLLRRGDTHAQAQVLWASLHGALALLINYKREQFPGQPPPEDFVEQVLENSLRGLAAEPVPARRTARPAGRRRSAKKGR